MIGFIEDELLDGVELHVALADVIEKAARRGHDDVRHRAQCLDLRSHFHAADQACRRQLMIGAEEIEECFRLQRDLARWREDQCANAFTMREFLRNRQHERRRFSGAGLGESDDVATAERDLDHRRLNRRRMFKADACDEIDDRFAQSELCE